MSTTSVFVSSVQKELAEERRAVTAFVEGDPLLRRFFTVFLFEDLPASDRRADDAYLAEVDRSDLYVGLFGDRYGVEDTPLLAESLYLAKHIERMGTGTEDMIGRCRAAGLPEPRFSVRDGFVCTLGRRPESALAAVAPEVTPPLTPPVTPPVTVLLGGAGEMSNAELRARTGLADRTHLREHYIDPALAQGFIEPTVPDKPRSRPQKYRLTEQGRRVLSASNQR